MDVLIYTEVENRELDAACLIKTELENRGYSVAIERYNRICDSGNMLLYHPKVVVLPWLYNDEFLMNFINSNNSGRTRFVNLQSEQILSENFINNNYHMPKGYCKDEYHLSWGPVTTQRFIDAGIPCNHIWECGNINMDFNSSFLNKVYKTKEQIAKEFQLDEGKKWCLFISSFTHPSMSKKEKEAYISNFPFLKRFVDISINSQKIVCEWIERYAKSHSEIEFIYRPHPVELDSKLVRELANNCNNIHIIGDGSIRQWIKVCEKNTTWFSTSIADAYFQKKECAVLRPITITKEDDCELFYNCKSINCYVDFEKFISENEKKCRFPISEEKMSLYYGNHECGNNYLLFCNHIESLIKNNEIAKPFKYRGNLTSRIHRNVISYIFQINKRINMSIIFAHHKGYIYDQLMEKRSSQKQFDKHKNELLKVLKEILH